LWVGRMLRVDEAMMCRIGSVVLGCGMMAGCGAQGRELLQNRG
jgi:hypothetical protein